MCLTLTLTLTLALALTLTLTREGEVGVHAREEVAEQLGRQRSARDDRAEGVTWLGLGLGFTLRLG